MSKLRIALAVLFAAAIAVPLAWASGLWPNFPLVASATYCASILGTGPTQLGNTGQGTGTTVTGAPSTICGPGAQISAGPTGLAGSEIVPMDTEYSNQPYTVTVPVVLLPGGSVAYQAVNALVTSFSIPNNVNMYILDPTGTVTSLTLTFPPNPINGQTLRIASSKTITNFLPAALASSTITNAPTILTASTTTSFNYEWVYLTGSQVNGPNGTATNVVNGPTWYRLQ